MDETQTWDLNQTWPVGQKWCRFTNALSQNVLGPSSNFQRKNKFLTTFFAISALDTAYLRIETSHRQTKMLLSMYNISPKSWPTFRDLWPRYGWDPFAHCDPPFDGHYVTSCNHDSWGMSSLYVCICVYVFWATISAWHCGIAGVIEAGPCPHQNLICWWRRARRYKFAHSLTRGHLLNKLPNKSTWAVVDRGVGDWGSYPCTKGEGTKEGRG